MSEEKEISFKVRFAVLVFCTSVAIIAVLILIQNIFSISHRTPDNDFTNWAAVVIEIGVAAFISGVILLYDRKLQKDTDKLEKKRMLSEQQHFKERLTNEIHVFLYRINEVANNGSKVNASHAERNLEALRTINSIFSIPSEIRSEFDDIISIYDSILENAEHGCMRPSDISGANIESANKLKDFFASNFFKENNNEKIDKNLFEINKVLIRISEQNKKN